MGIREGFQKKMDLSMDGFFKNETFGGNGLLNHLSPGRI